MPKLILKTIHIVLFFLTVVAGAVLCASFMGRGETRIGDIDVQLRLKPAKHGSTNFDFKPFGTVYARTHNTPVAVTFSITNINSDNPEKVVNGVIEHVGSPEKIELKLRKFAKKYFFKLVLLGALGGSIGAALGAKIRPLRIVAGALTGAAAISILSYATYFSYNPAAFNNLEFTGLIENAPRIIDFVQRSFAHKEQLSKELEKFTGDLGSFYREFDSLAIPEMEAEAATSTVTLLHISDIHNNPIGAKFVLELNRQFRPDVIVDTGDITDMGTPLELSFVENLKSLKTPHIFIPGNHDSPDVVAQLATEFGVQVLDGATASVKGILFAGYGDPSGAKELYSEEDKKALDEQADKIIYNIAQAGVDPDVILVHNPIVAEKIAGHSMLVVFGHEHRPFYKIKDKTILLGAGSTGAAGIRYFQQAKPGNDYSANIVTIKTGESVPEVSHIDVIRFNQKSGEFSLKRTAFSAKTQEHEKAEVKKEGIHKTRRRNL